MKMEKNGLRSCGNDSRRTKIKNFFIKDMIENEGVELNHCGIESMLTDFLTKPLQGSLFKKIRNILMGISPFLVEERVENYGKISENKTSIKVTDRQTSKSMNVINHHILTY